ncbi:MAG: glycolate oxidase subunit GlcE [Burkholderiaceae bacterium]
MDPALQRIVEQVTDAAAKPAALRIRGGGTKDFYGQRLQGEILDTRDLRGVVAYEPSELVVTVRCGTPLQELEALLAQQGQCLAFEPPHFGPAATVGGMVAAGLSGPARASSGPVRDYVLGVQMVNGKAEALRFGGQVMKNVAGYDVSRLMVGAMGVLGVITEVSLKVLPRPLAQATLVFACSQQQALRMLQDWAAMPLPLNASCWESADGGRLHVRLRGAVAAVDTARAGLGGEPLEDDAAAAFWSGLREHTVPAFAPQDAECLWRLSVPDTAPVLQLAAPVSAPLLEWGGALRWVKAPVVSAAVLRAATAAVGGSASIFRRGSTASAQEVAVFHPLAATSLRIQRALKQQFDPAGIFNPARMFPQL